MYNKIEFRKKQKQRLKAFAQTEQKQNEDQLLAQKLLAHPLIKAAQTIGVTSALSFEVATNIWVEKLWQRQKKVYLAEVLPQKHQLDFVQYLPTSNLVKAGFGILTIDDKTAKRLTELDLLIVPGLAFDLESHQRLGFGGGYYDRFLAKYPKTKTISLVNSKMAYQEAKWPIEPKDIPVEELIYL